MSEKYPTAETTNALPIVEDCRELLAAYRDHPSGLVWPKARAILNVAPGLGGSPNGGAMKHQYKRLPHSA